jgi:hypothetical protein
MTTPQPFARRTLFLSETSPMLTALVLTATTSTRA